MDPQVLSSEVAELFAEAQQSVHEAVDRWLDSRAAFMVEKRRQAARDRRRPSPARKPPGQILGRPANYFLPSQRSFEPRPFEPRKPLFQCECGAEALLTNTQNGPIMLRCSKGCSAPWTPQKPPFVPRSAATEPIDSSYFEAQRRQLDLCADLLALVVSKQDLGWLTPKQFGWNKSFAADVLATLVRRGDCERRKIGMYGKRPTYVYRASQQALDSSAQRVPNAPMPAADRKDPEDGPCTHCSGPSPSCCRPWCSHVYFATSSDEAAVFVQE